MKISINSATTDDIKQWYGLIPCTMRALIFEVDGVPKAIGGILHQSGRAIAFMDIKDDASEFPVALMKATKKAMREIFSQYRQPIYAAVNEDLESAPRFLRHLGFIPVDENEKVMIWQQR